MLKYYDKTLKKEDVDLLLECGEKLGTSDINGETDNINMYIEMLNDAILESKGEKVEVKEDVEEEIEFVFQSMVILEPSLV